MSDFVEETPKAYVHAAEGSGFPDEVLNDPNVVPVSEGGDPRPVEPGFDGGVPDFPYPDQSVFEDPAEYAKAVEVWVAWHASEFAGVEVETVVPLPTLSGYAEGSYPEAQANGQQFDKDNGKVNPVATGKQEEAKLA